MAREIKLTQEGYNRLAATLEIEKQRLEEATRILQEQMESSDDYDDTGLEDAKREKARIQARIDSLEDTLARAVIIEAGEGDLIQLGSYVILQEVGGDDREIQVVNPAEASVLEAEVPKISDESPVGRRLIGRKEGETITITAAAGKVEYRILAINHR
jgi:transcription elongation factor GreA